MHECAAGFCNRDHHVGPQDFAQLYSDPCKDCRLDAEHMAMHPDGKICGHMEIYMWGDVADTSGPRKRHNGHIAAWRKSVSELAPNIGANDPCSLSKVGETHEPLPASRTALVDSRVTIRPPNFRRFHDTGRIEDVSEAR